MLRGDAFVSTRPGAQHFVEMNIDRLGEQLLEPSEERLEMRRLQMRVEIGAASPVLVEHEPVRVFGVDMKVVADAARLGAGRGDLIRQNRPELVARLILRHHHSDDRAEFHLEGASRIHRLRDWLIATAMRMMSPRAMSCWLYSSPISSRPLLITPIISEPTIEPTTVPAPPNKLVPPSTAAAITESSSPSPSWNRPEWSRPA